MQFESGIHEDYVGEYLYEGYYDLLNTRDEDSEEEDLELFETEIYYDSMGYIAEFEDEEENDEDEEL